MPKDLLTVSVQDIEFMLRIGVTAEERARLQPVMISLTVQQALDHDFTHSPAEDLGFTIDYAFLLNEIRNCVARMSEIILIETLGDRIIERCLQNSRIERVDVSIMKQEFAAKNATASVTMTRYRQIA